MSDTNSMELNVLRLRQFAGCLAVLLQWVNSNRYSSLGIRKPKAHHLVPISKLNLTTQDINNTQFPNWKHTQQISFSISWIFRPHKKESQIFVRTQSRLIQPCPEPPFSQMTAPEKVAVEANKAETKMVPHVRSHSPGCDALQGRGPLPRLHMQVFRIEVSAGLKASERWYVFLLERCPMEEGPPWWCPPPLIVMGHRSPSGGNIQVRTHEGSTVASLSAPLCWAWHWHNWKTTKGHIIKFCRTEGPDICIHHILCTAQLIQKVMWTHLAFEILSILFGKHMWDIQVVCETAYPPVFFSLHLCNGSLKS